MHPSLYSVFKDQICTSFTTPFLPEVMNSSYCYVRKKDCAESRVKWTKTENKAAALLCSFRVNTNRWSWLLHLAQTETWPGPSSKITLTQLLLTLSLGLSESKAVRP
ncbi:uncharacterized protein WM294_008518 [Sarcoramphus papa]